LKQRRYTLEQMKALSQFYTYVWNELISRKMALDYSEKEFLDQQKARDR